MSTVIRAFQELTRWGLREDTSSEEANYIRLTNALLFLMLLGSTIETFALFATRAYTAAMINSTAPLVFGGGLLLMRSGRTHLARVLVLTIGYGAAYIMAAILGPAVEFQFIILIASAMAFTFFRLKEWKYVLYGLVLPLASLVLLELTNYQPVLGLERAHFSASQLTAIRLTTVSVVWLMMIGQFAYFIRSRQMAQEQLIASAKLVALGQLAAGIAHEVNNPLAVISGLAQRLSLLSADGTLTQEEIQKTGDKIADVSERIGSIVRGLLALSRDASGDPFVEIPLDRVLNLTLDCCRVRVEAQGVSFRVDEIPKNCRVIGREAQISEVFLNLINNSLDAIKLLDDRWIEIKVNSTGAHAEVAITDSGNGIPLVVRRKMFDPFFTTKPAGKGTGLGLSVSRGIMTAHRGQISYDDKSPRTRFVIRLPAVSE